LRWRAMRILVTGGAGFVGSHIVDALVAGQHDVVVLDSLPKHVYSHADLIEADVTDPSAVRAAIRNVDAVCHQAAMVGLGVNLSDISAYVHNNDLGTAVLLEQLDAVGFQGRIVLASSMVVYGEGSYACPRHGEIPSPPPRTVADLDAGRFEPLCPACSGPLES